MSNELARGPMQNIHRDRTDRERSRALDYTTNESAKKLTERLDDRESYELREWRAGK